MTDPEELIDSVLRGYSDAEPRADYERRILARALRPRVNPWAALVPVFVVALFLVIWTRRPDPVQVKLPEAVKVEHNIATFISPAKPSRVRRIYKPLPRQPAFPTPTPLTDDERALLSIADDNVLPMTDSGPIQIAPIQIAALEKEN